MTDTPVANISSADREGSLDPRYIRRLLPDPSGGYTATIHEFPGCIAEGDSPEEALSRLNSVALSWIESAQANGYPITPPIDYDGASGKVALRISRRLHQLAAERADLEGVSLNQFIGNALSCYLGQQDGMRRLALQFESALTSGMTAAYARLYSAHRELSTNGVYIFSADILGHRSSHDGHLTNFKTLHTATMRTIQND